MARKGVNLLEGDDEEREDEPEDDTGDDGGNYERRRGGFVDVLMVILFVCVMLGGVAWAGYQFWWLPKVKKEEHLNIARKTQEKNRMRLAKMKNTPERARTNTAPARASQPESGHELNRNQSAPGGILRPERSGAPNKSEKPEPAPVAVMKHKTPPAIPSGKPAIPIASVAETPTSPPGMTATPGRKALVVAKRPEKKEKAVRPAQIKKQASENKADKSKSKTRAGTKESKQSKGYYYSVQVASCSTTRCAESFAKRLEGKGFSAFKVAGARRIKKRSSQFTEVRLGSFASPTKARTLAGEARKKNIPARVYRYNNQWIVAAGSFRNLEEAALLLDRAEDSGLRGELASRLQSGVARRLYRISTGKFETLREALAFRKKIRLAGFSDAIVVRRRSKK